MAEDIETKNKYFTGRVCYFISNFYFFTKWYPFKNYEKCFLFHLKSSFCSWDIQVFVIFSLSTLSRFKKANGSGIIYGVINWLTWISRCNFWNNSKTTEFCPLKGAGFERKNKVDFSKAFWKSSFKISYF